MKLGMLTKLKYVGTSRNDLLIIYKQFIRNNLDYCSSLYHSTLTQEQSSKLERVQKVCLRVILGEEYISYENALKISGLERVETRREARCLTFALKCVKHPKHYNLFPKRVNDHTVNCDLRKTEKFISRAEARERNI